MSAMKGAALVITVWLIALATVMALNHTRTTRTDGKITAAELLRHKARAAAEAGIWRAVYELDTPDSTAPWPTNSDSVEFDFDGIPVTVFIQDVTGLVDLNAAPQEVLNRLVTHVIQDPARAGPIVDAIMDWRDRDSDAREFGAEDIDYRSAGFDYGAKDGAFNTREELQLVAGMSLSDYALLAPYITVYAQRNSIKLNAAPHWILAAMADGTAEESGEPTAARSGPVPRHQVSERGASTSTRSGGTTFEILTRARAGSAVSTLAATIQLNRSRRQGPKVAILTWRESWPATMPVENNNGNPPAE